MRPASVRTLGTVIGLAIVAAAVARSAAVGTEAGMAARSAPTVQGLLVSEPAAGLTQRASIISLAGKKLPVPERLQKLGWGVWRLSPDARFVAEARFGTVSQPEGSVLVGRVHGGTMQTVLQESCRPSCAAGPTYAWSPDSRLLAVSAGGLEAPSVVRLVDVHGRVVKSFSMPNVVPEYGEKVKVTYRVVSWSPDGSRLLLLRDDRYYASAALVLEIGTGKWHEVAEFGGCDGPEFAWSPDGRLIALSSRATQDCLDLFALIDAVHAKTLVSRHWDKGLGQGGTVWAPDSKSVFGTATTYRSGTYSHRIDRIYLTGRRVNVITPMAGAITPRVALATGLVYDTTNALYLHHFTTGRTDRLMSLRGYWRTVEPLQRLP